MKPNAISLQPGSAVMHGGETWIIERPEGFDRVLAQRSTDERREFLAISELKAVPRRVAAPSDGSDEEEGATDSEGNGEPDDEAEGNLSAVKLNWRELISRERIRVMPDEKQLTLEDKEAIAEAVKEFELLIDALTTDSVRERGKRMRDIAKEKKYSLATAYRRMEIVRVWQCADALMRKLRSDKGQPRLTKKQQEIIDLALTKFRFVETPRTIPKVLELINGRLRNHKPPEPEIGRTSLYHRMNLKTRREQLLAHGRKEEAKNKYRPKAGTLPDADYPLAVVQADHSPIQVCLVDEEERKPIGDAWLTLIIDCYSRMVLGYFLTFDAPSTLSTGMALARALLPKDDLLRELDVKGQWPCWGFPDVFLVDNGADLSGKMVQGARRQFKFTIRNRPVGGPEFGGHVESAFKTFMNESKATPGTKRSNPSDRAEYDSEGRAVMTIREYERLLVDCIVNEYHLVEHSGDDMNRRAPLQRWKEGIFDGEIYPPTGLPDIPSNPAQLRIALMPIESRPIIKACVRIFSCTYFSVDLARLSRTIDVEKPLEDRQFEIRYDPRNIFTIWVRNPETGEYITAEAQNVNWTQRTLWEHRAIRKRMGHPDIEFKDERWESLELREQMKEKASKNTKEVRLKNEKAKRHAEDSLMKPPAKPKSPSKPANPAPIPMDLARLAALRSRVRAADTGEDAK